MAKLWGEIPTVPEAESGIAALEREQITKPRPLEVEGAPLFQPSSRHYPPTNEPLPAKWFQIDPVTLHTIRLIQHARKTRQAINHILQQQQSTQSDIKSEPDAFPTVPPIPEYSGPPLKHMQRTPIQYTPANFESDFVKGIGETPPIIDEVANRKLLRRSVAAILAHLSFENTAESVLETLTDITHEYFLQFMKHLRSAADSEAMHGPSGFPDIIERVFHEMGIGSVTSLHEFYQTRVLTYHKNMLATCKQLVGEYEKLQQQPLLAIKSPSASTSSNQKDTLHVIRIKEEPSAEIQFPVLDENDEVSEAEQLLQLEGLGSFEITVEHETTGGLTTEVESKWPQSVKAEPQDAKGKNGDAGDEQINVTDTGGSASGQDSVPQTPRTPREIVGDASDSVQDPGSVSSALGSSPHSPGASGGSRPKKKKLS